MGTEAESVGKWDSPRLQELCFRRTPRARARRWEVGEDVPAVVQGRSPAAGVGTQRHKPADHRVSGCIRLRVGIRPAAQAQLGAGGARVMGEVPFWKQRGGAARVRRDVGEGDGCEED